MKDVLKTFSEYQAQRKKIVFLRQFSGKCILVQAAQSRSAFFKLAISSSAAKVAFTLAKCGRKNSDSLSKAKRFHPISKFLGKTGAYLSEASSRCSTVS